ncbi:AAA family ATPase, partial [Erysipelothrix rhusiopathiae]
MIIKEIEIENYKGITDKVRISIGRKIVPIVGMNESGKTTIIEAIYAFDNGNDELNNGSHVNEIKNQYSVINNKDAKISFH